MPARWKVSDCQQTYAEMVRNEHLTNVRTIQARPVNSLSWLKNQAANAKACMA